MSKKKVLLRGVFINRDTNGEGVLKVGTTLIRVSTVMGILYSLQHNECSEIIHMFCDECKRATLLIGGRLRIDKISYKNSTFPFRFQAWLSANAFNM